MWFIFQVIAIVPMLVMHRKAYKNYVRPKSEQGKDILTKKEMSIDVKEEVKDEITQYSGSFSTLKSSTLLDEAAFREIDAKFTIKEVD